MVERMSDMEKEEENEMEKSVRELISERQEEKKGCRNDDNE